MSTSSSLGITSFYKRKLDVATINFVERFTLRAAHDRDVLVTHPI
jgi:hypothetical protein